MSAEDPLDSPAALLSLLRGAGLAHLTEALAGETLFSIAERLHDDRPSALAHLKLCGVKSLRERQAVANRVSRAVREGLLDFGGRASAGEAAPDLAAILSQVLSLLNAITDARLEAPLTLGAPQAGSSEGAPREPPVSVRTALLVRLGLGDCASVLLGRNRPVDAALLAALPRDTFAQALQELGLPSAHARAMVDWTHPARTRVGSGEPAVDSDGNVGRIPARAERCMKLCDQSVVELPVYGPAIGGARTPMRPGQTRSSEGAESGAALSTADPPAQERARAPVGAGGKVAHGARVREARARYLGEAPVASRSEQPTPFRQGRVESGLELAAEDAPTGPALVRQVIASAMGSAVRRHAQARLRHVAREARATAMARAVQDAIDSARMVEAALQRSAARREAEERLRHRRCRLRAGCAERRLQASKAPEFEGESQPDVWLGRGDEQGVAGGTWRTASVARLVVITVRRALSRAAARALDLRVGMRNNFRNGDAEEVRSTGSAPQLVDESSHAQTFHAHPESADGAAIPPAVRQLVSVALSKALTYPRRARAAVIAAAATLRDHAADEPVRGAIDAPHDALRWNVRQGPADSSPTPAAVSRRCDEADSPIDSEMLTQPSAADSHGVAVEPPFRSSRRAAAAARDAVLREAQADRAYTRELRRGFHSRRVDRLGAEAASGPRPIYISANGELRRGAATARSAANAGGTARQNGGDGVVEGHDGTRSSSSKSLRLILSSGRAVGVGWNVCRTVADLIALAAKLERSSMTELVARHTLLLVDSIPAQALACADLHSAFGDVGIAPGSTLRLHPRLARLSQATRMTEQRHVKHAANASSYGATAPTPDKGPATRAGYVDLSSSDSDDGSDWSCSSRRNPASGGTSDVGTSAFFRAVASERAVDPRLPPRSVRRRAREALVAQARSGGVGGSPTLVIFHDAAIAVPMPTVPPAGPWAFPPAALRMPLAGPLKAWVCGRRNPPAALPPAAPGVALVFAVDDTGREEETVRHLQPQLAMQSIFFLLPRASALGASIGRRPASIVQRWQAVHKALEATNAVTTDVSPIPAANFGPDAVTIEPASLATGIGTHLSPLLGASAKVSAWADYIERCVAAARATEPAIPVRAVVALGPSTVEPILLYAHRCAAMARLVVKPDVAGTESASSTDPPVRCGSLASSATTGADGRSGGASMALDARTATRRIAASGANGLLLRGCMLALLGGDTGSMVSSHRRVASARSPLDAVVDAPAIGGLEVQVARDPFKPSGCPAPPVRLTPTPPEGWRCLTIRSLPAAAAAAAAMIESARHASTIACMPALHHSCPSTLETRTADASADARRSLLHILHDGPAESSAAFYDAAAGLFNDWLLGARRLNARDVGGAGLSTPAAEGLLRFGVKGKEDVSGRSDRTCLSYHAKIPVSCTEGCMAFHREQGSHRAKPAPAKQTDEASGLVAQLSGLQLGCVGAAAVGHELVSGVRVHSCDLSRNRIGDDGGVALGEALRFVATQVNYEHGISTAHEDDLLDDLCVRRKESLQATKEESVLVNCPYSFGNGVPFRANGVVQPILSCLLLNDNQVGCAGVAAIARAIAQGAGLEELHLERNYLQPLGAAAFADAIVDTHAAAEGRLGFDGAGVAHQLLPASCLAPGTPTGARCALPSLLVLSLSENSLGCCGAAALAHSLLSAAPLQRLQVLCLRRNSIREAGAEALATAIRHHRSLVELDLSQNALSWGIVSLADALQENSSVVRLHLQGNGINAAGVRALVKTLEGGASPKQLTRDPSRCDERQTCATDRHDQTACGNSTLRSLGAGLLDEAKAALSAEPGNFAGSMAALIGECSPLGSSCGTADGALTIAEAEALAYHAPSNAMRLAAALRRNDRLAKLKATRQAAAEGHAVGAEGPHSPKQGSVVLVDHTDASVGRQDMGDATPVRSTSSHLLGSAEKVELTDLSATSREQPTTPTPKRSAPEDLYDAMTGDSSSSAAPTRRRKSGPTVGSRLLHRLQLANSKQHQTTGEGKWSEAPGFAAEHVADAPLSALLAAALAADPISSRCPKRPSAPCALSTELETPTSGSSTSSGEYGAEASAHLRSVRREVKQHRTTVGSRFLRRMEGELARSERRCVRERDGNPTRAAAFEHMARAMVGPSETTHAVPDRSSEDVPLRGPLSSPLPAMETC